MNQTNALHQIEQYRIILELAVKAIVNLPDLERVERVDMLSMGQIACRAPHDYELMKRHQKQLEEAGWKPNGEHRFTDDGTLGRYYRQEQVHLSIFYRPEIEGSTCAVHQIGTRTEPIVEVTCKEGAA